MKVRYKLLAFLVFAILSIVACLRLNKEMIPTNFTKEMANIQEVIFNLEPPYSKVGYYTDTIYIDNMKELLMLYEESDIVIKGKAITKKQDSQIIQTTVVVNEVIQGEVKEDEITVMEQAAIIDGMRLMVDGGSVLPMIYEKEYLLFLKENKDYASGNVYRLTSMQFAKFPTQVELNAFEADYPKLVVGEEGVEEQGYTKEILEYDVVFFNPIDIARYESGEYSLEDESSLGRYQALLSYRDTFKDTYMKFYNELKEDGLLN